MNRVKAYTVMEMIVVMIISGIVVTMSYTVFIKVSLLNNRVGEIYTRNYNVFLFNRLLASDVLKSDAIMKNSNGFYCIYKDHVVNYESDNVLVRTQQSVRDTLVSLSQTELTYEYIDKAKTIIQRIVLTGQYDGQPITMTYEKKYGSDLLMKLDEQGN